MTSLKRMRPPAPRDGEFPPVDLRFIKALEPFAEPFVRYFHSEVRGIEHVPEGPALIVGNHNGGVMTPDSFLFGLAFYRHNGFTEPMYALGHDALFKVPGVAEILRRLGGTPASPGAADRLLHAGKKVLVYPGGDWETHRPSYDRDRIDFAGRKGFVETALRTGAPIVPVVAAGAHEGWYVLTRGEKIAKKLGLDRRFRLRVFPIALGFPFGLVVGPVSVHLPPPGTILIEVLEPIRLEGDPDDPAALDAGYARVTGTMQAVLTRLAKERRARMAGKGRLKGRAREVARLSAARDGRTR
jgi:1-acyl-sn-glycerol-3-phosphate acyltransferase